MSRRAPRFAAGVFLIALAAPLSLTAADLPEFPQNAAQWVNGRPVTLEGIRGKAVVLWFFEETSPQCQAQWPLVAAIAGKYQGLPIVFIGVNSGTPRQTVEAFARQFGATWPILVDSQREYERAVGVPTINQQNYSQLRIITSKGELKPGDPNDVEATIKKALEGAAWKVDPVGMPQSLQTAWTAVEFANYSTAAPLLRRASTGPGSAEAKPFVDKLKDAIQKAIDADIAAAKAAEDEGKPNTAIKAYQRMPQKFQGFDLPPDLAARIKKLSDDPKFKAGVAAQREVDQAKRQITATAANVRGRAIAALEKVAAEFPDSDAATEARALLQQAMLPKTGP